MIILVHKINTFFQKYLYTCLYTKYNIAVAIVNK